MTARHALKIISRHDARAECACGGWFYSFTGERSEEEIRQVWAKHASPVLSPADALAGLLEYSNGKLGKNPYLIPEYKQGLCALARMIGWRGDWMDTLEEYRRREK